MYITDRNNRTALYVLQIVMLLHLSSALFGDDEYFKASKKVNCAMNRLEMRKKCDGKIHCTDMSDEENCNACRGQNVFHCNNNRQVYRMIITKIKVNNMLDAYPFAQPVNQKILKLGITIFYMVLLLLSKII